MFEELTARAAALGEARRRAARARLAAALRAEAPRGVAVEEVEEGVRLSGRALLLRSITDPALRWIGARAA
jgi:folate-binding Fe-S cluster repair protein YgfZ